MANHPAVGAWMVTNTPSNIGVFFLDRYPALAADGQSWLDDGSRTKVSLREAANDVTMVIGGDGRVAAVTAHRMGPGNPGFPGGTPAAGTPTT